MGCDGGTIPKRDELVKTKKKPEQKDRNAERAFRWKHCAASQAPLQPPVVACELGRLYSKESVIETLLEKSATATPEPTTSAVANGAEVVAHIRSIRDVKTLNLTENPASNEDSVDEKGVKGDGYIDDQKAKWICPISGQEMNGRFRFVFLWGCGCVMSEKALKEMSKNKKDDGYECLKCQKPFEMSDVILLNPTEPEDMSSLKERMDSRRAKAKLAKEAKKSKKNGGEVEESQESSQSVEGASTSATQNGGIETDTKEKSKVAEKRKIDSKNGFSSTNHSKLNGVASKKSKPEVTSVLASTSSSTATAVAASRLMGYSVAKDPKVSSTYKSLFTSSETAKTKDQNRAHWVTYNPFYN